MLAARVQNLLVTNALLISTQFDGLIYESFQLTGVNHCYVLLNIEDCLYKCMIVMINNVYRIKATSLSVTTMIQ